MAISGERIDKAPPTMYLTETEAMRALKELRDGDPEGKYRLRLFDMPGSLWYQIEALDDVGHVGWL